MTAISAPALSNPPASDRDIPYDDAATVLIIDQDNQRLAVNAAIVGRAGLAWSRAQTPEAVLAKLSLAPSVAVVILALDSLGPEPELLLSTMCSRCPRLAIIAITDQESLDLAAHVLQFDAAYFLAEHVVSEELLSMLDRITNIGRRRVDGGADGAMRDPGGDEMRRLSELSEDVARIAQALASLVAKPGIALRSQTGPTDEGEAEDASVVTSRFVRELIRQRRAREQYFPAELFADPAWDILLDLSAARLDSKRVSVSSLCIAAAVPSTTALRWIKGMTDAGLLVRRSDPADGRRIFIDLSDQAAAAMLDYLGGLVRSASP